MPNATALQQKVVGVGWLRHIERSLQDVFGDSQPFVFWRADHDAWERIDWRDGLEVEAGGACLESQPSVSPLQAAQLPGAWTTRDDDGSRWLYAPIKRQGELVFVAASNFTDTSETVLLRLAHAFLTNYALQARVDQLSDENESFAFQFTQDLEELTFLRSMTDRLEVSDASFDLTQMAATVLPSLNQSINAEQIILVEAAHESRNHNHSDLSPPVGGVLHSTGSPIANESVLLRLVNDFRDQAAVGPVVNNRLQRSSGGAYRGVHGFILSPLLKTGQTIGWLLAINRVRYGDDRSEAPKWEFNDHEFGSSEATLLASAASILATHATNVALLREKEKLLINVVRSLVSAIEAKDKYTCGHSERVALFGKCLGEAIGLKPQARERLYLTGLLHDVGKIGVRDSTLTKPGRLTAEEFEEIKRHPDEGWSILHDLEQLRYVLPGVLHHHERVDGRGYPDGLAGDAIPLDGRILAVADAYDAMTSDRPYRQGLPQEKAVAILREGAGTQWDADLIDAFLRVMPRIIEIRDSYQPRIAPQRQRPMTDESDRT